MFTNKAGRARQLLPFLVVLLLTALAAAWFFRERGVWSVTRTADPPAPVANQPAASRRPTLWVLSVGISRYENPELRLGFAAADAEALAAVFVSQKSGPLYSDVKTRVLLDREATRASILEALDAFLGQAAPVDVGVIYLAGHGVRDLDRGTSYFLPATASADRPHIEGLDMAELSRQLQVLHRNLRRLIVILDTCHAGEVARPETRIGEDLASRLSPAEGLCILAAARSGELSTEIASLGHGAFTHALLDGLQGAAANPDGLITVFGLAGHAARLVQELSRGQQHPYQAIVGEDLPLAANPGRFREITPPPLPTPALVAAPAARERIAVMSFENLRPDPKHDWMERALRQDLTTAFAAVSSLEVYEDTEVRFLAQGAADPLEAASRAGMAKLVDGTYWVESDHITITAYVKNVQPLRRIASARIDGRLEEFLELRGRIVVNLLGQLGLEPPPDEMARVRESATTDLGARRLLFNAELPRSGAGLPRPTPAATPDPLASIVSGFLGWLHVGSVSLAAESPEAELRETLEGYRAAFEAKNLESLAAYYTGFNAEQADALRQYFENADDLQVEFTDVRVTIIAERASVSLTRQDRFVDHRTRERQQVVVRLTKLFVRGTEGWQIAPEQ